MVEHRGFLNGQILGIAAFLIAVALLSGTPVRAQQPQQPKLTAPYAKAALLSLLAIELDTSASQDKAAGMAEMSATQAQIDAAEGEALTIQEDAITELLRQIYVLKLHDNNLLTAYRKLSEVEDDQDVAGPTSPREKRAYAESQLADDAENEASIENREKACFAPLEESLHRRSVQNITACFEWIGKAKLSDNFLASGR
jgi:hypothetical protein